MTLSHETYHRRVQVGASRRRLEDAQKLLEQQRWVGAMYLGGYAVECALVALICFMEGKTDFRDTRAFASGIKGATIHNLTKLVGADSAGKVRGMIETDSSDTLKQSWNLVSGNWQYEKLRYYDKDGIGNHTEAQKKAQDFIGAVKQIQGLLLRVQGE